MMTMPEIERCLRQLRLSGVRDKSWPRLFGQRPAGFKWIPAGLC
ncbi:hypothetical protein ACVMFA_006310 [Bradyrhizobium liaoningense]